MMYLSDLNPMFGDLDLTIVLGNHVYRGLLIKNNMQDHAGMRMQRERLLRLRLDADLVPVFYLGRVFSGRWSTHKVQNLQNSHCIKIATGSRDCSCPPLHRQRTKHPNCTNIYIHTIPYHTIPYLTVTLHYITLHYTTQHYMT